MKLIHMILTTLHSWMVAVDRFNAACYNLDAYFRLHFNVVVDSSRDDEVWCLEAVIVAITSNRSS